jgi:HEPN domain-containing protein
VRSAHEAEWRLRIAGQHLEEAHRANAAGAVLSAADQSRKAVENAIKAAIACYGPVPRTHEAGTALSALLQAGVAAPPAVRAHLARLVAIGQRHGLVEHLRLSYGDEQTGETPLDLVTPATAAASLADAEECTRLAAAVLADATRSAAG